MGRVDVEGMLAEIPSQAMTDWMAFFSILNEVRSNGGQIRAEPKNRDVYGALRQAFPQFVRKKK